MVGVSSDKMCLAKGKVPVYDETKRMEMVGNLRFVDKVFIEESMEQKVDDVKKYGADIFVLGDDYETIFPQMKEYQQLLNLGCSVVFLKRTPEISTSQIKENLFREQLLSQNKNTIHSITKDITH